MLRCRPIFWGCRMPWFIVPEGVYDWAGAPWATGCLSGASVVTALRWSDSNVPHVVSCLWVPTSAPFPEVLAELPKQGGPYVATKVSWSAASSESVFPEQALSTIQGVIYRCRNDRDWTMDWIGGSVEELTGYTPRELLGEHAVSYSGLILAADRDAVAAAVGRGIEGREAFQMKYRVRRKDGAIVWVSERCVALVNDDGAVLGLSGHIVAESGTRTASDREQAGGRGCYNVVVVDDEVSIVTLLAKLLERSNCKVIRATSIEDALSGVAAFHGVVDVLLTDVVLEAGSGCDLAEKLRWRLPHLKVIYMSGYAADGRVLEEVNQGRSSFLSKPFLPSTALEKIRQVMGESSG